MSRPVPHFAALLLLGALLLQACASVPRSPAQAERERLAARAERVTIIRDDFGVPHVYGRSDADAVFGLVYAQAEDDFPRVERNYVWALGRLAEVEGEAALWSDLRARLYMTEADARARYAGAPEWLRALCQAWADALNWYLATHPEVTPELLERFEPWMVLYFFEGSIGGDIEQIPLAGIEAFYGRGQAVSAETLAAARQRRAEARGPVGSNGFAIAGERTASGHPLLLINPHTSFFFRGEVHAVSEEGLDAYGAVTWGQFFVYQGFNETAGWMHTSTGVDFMDEFVEDIVVRDGRRYYRYGEELRAVRESEVTLAVRTAAGPVERRFTVYHTHHGPITHSLDGRWVATRINWDPVPALAQSFLRSKARSYEEFRDLMDLRTNSSNNTVFADAEGNIAYFHGNFVPRRDPRFDYARPVDGADPATDWRGLHEVDELVSLLNPATGWLQNCNSTPFTAAGPDSPRAEDYPRYMAPDAENFRGIQAVRLLSSARDLDLDGLIELAYDPYLAAFEVLLPALIDAYEATGRASHPELAGPVAALRNWDRRVRLDSAAMTLAHFYGRELLEGGARPSGLPLIERIRYHARSAPPQERISHLAAAVARLEADFGRWAVPWGEVNRYQRLDGALEQRFDDDAPSLPVPMASGTWGALASFNARPGDDTRRIYGRSGNSFVAVVEFGPRLRAKSLLAGGQSGDAASPHFDDQARRYVERRFKDVAFYREDVERRATRRYHPGLD